MHHLFFSSLLYAESITRCHRHNYVYPQELGTTPISNKQNTYFPQRSVMEWTNFWFYGSSRHTSTKLSVATGTLDSRSIRSPGECELLVWSEHCWACMFDTQMWAFAIVSLAGLLSWVAWSAFWLGWLGCTGQTISACAWEIPYNM